MVEIINKAKRRVPNIIKEEGFISLISRVFYYSKLIFYIYYLKYKISKLQNTYNLKSLLDFAYSTLEELIKPQQIRYEFLEILKLLKNVKPKIILEIGTASGGTLFLFSRIIDNNATIISIDLPGGDFGGGYLKIKTPLYKSFALPEQKIFLIRGNSHSKLILNKIKHILNNNKLDFLFIDGDHTYQGVKEDFENFSPLVKKGGIIAFHDIVSHSPEWNVNVIQFWNEIKNDYQWKEIIENKKQGWAGIGVIFK